MNDTPTFRSISNKQRFDTSERTENVQRITNRQERVVRALTSVDCERFVLVRFAEREHRLANVDRRDRREARAKDLLLAVALAAKLVQRGRRVVDHLEADILAFAIAVQPQHEIVATARLREQMFADRRARIRLRLDDSYFSFSATATATHNNTQQQ